MQHRKFYNLPFEMDIWWLPYLCAIALVTGKVFLLTLVLHDNSKVNAFEQLEDDIPEEEQTFLKQLGWSKEELQQVEPISEQEMHEWKQRVAHVK